MPHATALNAKTTNPRRVPVVAKITFLPNRVKRGLIVFLNSKLRCNFSGGPPVKTGGFPPTYGVGGGAFAPGKSPFGRWTRLWRVGVVLRDFGDSGNAKLRFDFSGGPPVKTGGFPRPYGGRGGAGYARSEKFSARFASPLYHPVGNRRAFLINEKRSRLTNGLCHPRGKSVRT